MKLYYEVETNNRFEHGELIVETEAVECEVDDFDVICAYMRGKHPATKMAIIGFWFGADDEHKARFLSAIMKKHGEKIEDRLRQRALEGAFGSLRRV